MTEREFQDVFDRIIIEVTTISRTKGIEYTQGKDRLQNFKETGADLNVPPEKICFLFMKKHWDSLRSFMKFGESHSEEHVFSRIDDLILYLILLRAILEENERERL